MIVESAYPVKILKNFNILEYRGRQQYVQTIEGNRNKLDTLI